MSFFHQSGRWIPLLLALVFAGAFRTGDARGAFALQEGDYYTANPDSRSIRQFSPTGLLKGTLSVSGEDADNVRGLLFLRGALYAVAAKGGGFNILRVDADLSVHVLYGNTTAYISGNISYGKLATNGNSLFVGTGAGLVRFDFDTSTASVIFNADGVFDAVVLPSGNLVVATSYTIKEITPVGVVVRQLTVAGQMLVDIRGLEYNAATNSLFVTHLYSPSMMRINYATGVIEKWSTHSYADDMFLTDDGRLLVGSRTFPAWVEDQDFGFVNALGTEDQMFVTEFTPSPPQPQRDITFSFTQRVNYVYTPVPDTEVLVGDIIVGRYSFDPLTPAEPYVGTTTNISVVYPEAVTSWEVTFVRLGITVRGGTGYFYIGNDTAFALSDNYTVVLLTEGTIPIRFPSGRDLRNFNVELSDIEGEGTGGAYQPGNMLTDTSLPLVPPIDRVIPSRCDGYGAFNQGTDQFQTRLLDLRLVPTPVRGFAFRGLGDLPGGISSSEACGISADGSVVVGESQGINGREAFRWTMEDGIVGLGDLPGGDFNSVARAVSGDGETVVGAGYSANGMEGFRWTKVDGMAGLGRLPGGSSFSSAAWGISADGLVITGQSAGDEQEAFRWTAAGGMVSLGNLAGQNGHSFGMAASLDGGVIVGGSSNRMNSNDEPFRWTASGMVGLGGLPGESSSHARGVSYDGTVVTGGDLTHAFRWTAGGMEDLGDLEGGGDFSIGYAVSGDGKVIVGYGNAASGQQAFRWTADRGMESIADLLTAGGVDLTGWLLYEATAVSADGQVIAGNGWHNGAKEAWIATIPVGSGPTPSPTPEPTATPSPTPRPSPTPKPTPIPDHRDRVPPKVRIEGSYRQITSLSFAIVSGTASDERGIRRVELSLNGAVFRRCAGVKNHWYQLVDLKVGRNVIRVRAIDTSGNESRIQSVVRIRN